MKVIPQVLLLFAIAAAGADAQEVCTPENERIVVNTLSDFNADHRRDVC